MWLDVSVKFEDYAIFLWIFAVIERHIFLYGGRERGVKKKCFNLKIMPAINVQVILLLLLLYW